MMMSSRIVFLLGTLIAIAGNADAAVSTCTGAANTVYNTGNNPDGTGANACKCVDGYVSIGGSNTIILGDVALSCTKCAPGYYLSAGSDTATAVCTQAPANKWHAGLNDLTSGYTAETATSCPTNTEAVAGSSALSDCKVKAGYYMVKNGFDSNTFTNNFIDIGSAHGLSNGDQVIYNDGSAADLTAGGAAVEDGAIYFVVEKTANTFKIAATSGGDALVLAAGHADNFVTSVLQVPANSYGAGGAAASETVTSTITATKTACPYGGTSAAGSDALADCTPAETSNTGGCGAASVKAKAVGGTCVCESTHYGLPIDATGTTTGVATLGCLPVAQSGAVTQTATVGDAAGICTLNGHGFFTGQKIIYNKVSAGSVLMIATGYTIADNTPLWVIKANDNTFTLASSRANALAGTGLLITNLGHANKYTLANGECPTNSATAYTAADAGSSGSLADCKVAAGYFISTKTTSAETLGSGALTIAPTTHYAPGGASLSEQLAAFVTATSIDCPFGGVTAATGKSLVTECTPAETSNTGGCGATSVNAKAVGGTCVCKAGYYGSPLDASDALLAVATKGCTNACPFGGSSADGATAVTDCTPAAAASTVNVVTVGGTSVCAANYYGTPKDTNDATLLVATTGCTACPTNTESVAGSSALSACTVKAGYYIATKATSATDATGLVISAIPANFYGTGGTQASHQTTNTITATKVACPFGGTSLAGAGFVEDCVPDCGASTVNALSARGTCICAANYYGAPTSTTSGAVATGGCTACPTNTEAVAGSSALSDCKVKAGYYMVKNGFDSNTFTNNFIDIGSAHGLSNGDQVIYNDGSAADLTAGGAAVEDGAIYFVVEKTANTFKIAATSGGTALVLAAGHADNFVTSVLQVPANSYGAGGAAASETVTDTITVTKIACPFAGTSAAGSVAKADCTPDCGTEATLLTRKDGGTCVCQSHVYGTPQDTNSATLLVATKGCKTATLSAAITGISAADPGVVSFTAHGYYTGQKIAYTRVGSEALTVADGYTIADGTPLWVIWTHANTFNLASSKANALAGIALKVTTAGHANKFTAELNTCPAYTQTAYSASNAGAGTLADCEVAPGFYISTATAGVNNVVGAMAASQITANHYAPGGFDANLAASDVTVTGTTSSACPYAGTTVRAGGKLSDCVPDCGSGTNAVANGGTCVCATTHYGTPVDANGATVLAATQGCSPVAQTVAIVQTAVTTGNTVASVIRIDGHGLYTGQKLLYTWGGTGTALTTSVAPLADGTAQYVIKVDANTFQLATTKTLALAGTSLAISNDGDDSQSFTPVSSGACPTNSATAYTAAAAGTGSLADCKVAAGYFIATESATATDATGLVISQVPANSYGAGGEDASQQTDNTVAATKTACVAKSTSAAGSDAISDCKTVAGFYLSVASPSATGSGRIAKSEANKYSAGGTSISTTTAETATACTYGGTSAIGSVVTGCTPSCGTVADASSGTCVCKAGRTGTPTPTTGTVTGGCTATLCAANQKVTSNACAACAAGTTIAKDGDASGTDTTCAATICTADHYVSSNACTDCAAGSTNAAGDDASGADTTCDIVSGASPLEVKLTSMISFLVIGFLALAM